MPDPDRFLPLKPLSLHALLALKEEERHGYAIKKAVAARTDGAIDLEPGTLYRLLARLQKQGLIAESERRPAPELDDERRRYYRITTLGRDVLTAEVRRLQLLLADDTVQALVSETKR